MKAKSRHFVLTIALCVLGAGMLLLLTRTLAVQVQATQITEPTMNETNAVAAQAMYDLKPTLIDRFDGTFTTAYQIGRAITHTGSAQYEWGRVITSPAGFTDTLWCAAGGSPPRNPDSDNYVNNMNTTVTYGPIGLRDAITVELQFAHRGSLADSGDRFEWGISTNGSTFTYTAVSPAGTWQTTTLSSVSNSNLASLLDKDQVYLAFRFRSDGSGTARGVFLDNVQVRTTYDASAFLPVIYRDWFQEYTYTHNFDPPSSTWTWPNGYYIRSVSEMLGDGYAYSEIAPYEFEDSDDFGIATAIQFAYGYKQDADTSHVYYISIEDNHDHVFLTGPSDAYALGDNWQYEAWMRRASDGDVNVREYGIMISPSPMDPRYPGGDNVYTFHIRLWTPDPDGTWIVKKWKVNSSDDHPAYWEQKGNSGLVSEANHVWNVFRIERSGDTLYFRLAPGGNPTNLQTVHTVTDANLADKYYVGFYAANAEISAWREWQFDNVSVHAAP